MNTWLELNTQADEQRDNPYPYMSVRVSHFDKLRAVVEAADRLANQDDHEQYENWKALCKALDELGVWEEDNTELWENGTLGCDERYVVKSSAEDEAEMEEAMKAPPVSCQTVNILEEPVTYNPTDEWIKSCATWPVADNEEFLQGVQAMARELLELRSENNLLARTVAGLQASYTSSNSKVHLLEERLTTAERVIEMCREIEFYENIEDVKAEIFHKLEAYDKAHKG